MNWLNKYKKDNHVKKSTLDLLRKFFGGDIEFRISSKIRQEISEIFKEAQTIHIPERNEDLEMAKAELEKQLAIARADLKKAKKAFKRGNMTRDVLFEYEYRLFEIRNQLDEINTKLRGL
jgi:hypothetical protein